MKCNTCSYIFWENRKLTMEQRKQLVDKGPFNLIFHGIEPDWIEEEMDDDPDFIRDVISQRLKTIIRDEVIYMLVRGYITLIKRK